MVLNKVFANYINQLVLKYPDIKSIWLIGSRANDTFTEESDWDFIVLGTKSILEALRNDAELQKENIDLLVVYDGNKFESPWGEKQKSGSLTGWEWKELSINRATYRAVKPIYNEHGEEEFNVKVMQYKGIRVYP